MDQDKQGASRRCRIGIHTWVTRVDAGARWQECGRCGKYSHKVRTVNRFPRSGTGEGGGGGF